MNGYYTTARKRSNIRPTLLVECEIPTRNRFAPVAECRGKYVPPLRPIGEIVRARIVRSAFGPVHGNIRMRIMNFAHRLGRAHVSVPGDILAVFVQARIVEF